MVEVRDGLAKTMLDFGEKCVAGVWDRVKRLGFVFGVGNWAKSNHLGGCGK